MLALVVVALGWTRPARAEKTAVALVVPAEMDALVAEAATRMRAELVAAGFDVRELRADERTEPDAQAAALTPPPQATIAIVTADGIAAADLWIVDRETHDTLVRHVDVGSVARHRAPSVLAVRAVELLRASLLHRPPPPLPAPEEKPAAKPADGKPAAKKPASSAAAKKPEEKKPPSAEADTDTDTDETADHHATASSSERARRRLRFGGELGAAALYGSRDVSAAFSPLLRVEYGTATWAGRLGLVLPVFGAEATARGGSATVREELATLDVAVRWPAEARVGLVGSAGGGGYHWHVSGEAKPPNVGHDSDRWGFVGGIGLGVFVRMGRSTGLLLDTHALWMAPPIAIQIAGVTAGRSSQPTLCTSLGFEVAL